MRWLGRSLVALVFSWGLFFYLIPGVSALWQQARPMSANIDRAKPSTFFPLNERQWLSFDIPQESDLFRFYSHAALKPGIPDEPVGYTIDYQWLDEGGEILQERQHHITTRPSASLPQADDSPPQALRFYDHQRSQPSRDHALYFTASAQPNARSLRLRVNTMDANIDEIGVRPYQQHQRPPVDVDISWQRMSSEQRDLLSRGSVYPSFLLSDYERKKLLSTYWKPVGPLGVLDKDYRIGTLYQLEANTPGLPPETPAADGLYASPQHWVTLVLLTDESRYRIEWQPLPDFSAPGLLQLHWQGVDRQQERRWQAPIDNGYWEGSLNSGLLQVAPDQPGILKLYWWQDDQWRDITPEKRYSRKFICQPDEPLAYTLAPGEDMQSLKVDARAYVRQDEPPVAVSPQVSFTVENETGESLYQASAELSTAHYPYLHFPDASSVESYVYEPLVSYLDANPRGQRLRINCNAPSLISLYSRPWRHPVNHQLPAHENRWISYEEREPAWFSVLPENFNTLVRLKRYHSLLWYFKPVGQSSILADGNYSRQSIVADDVDALEWQVFSRHDSDSQSRMESRGSAYLPLDAPATLFFAGRSNEKWVQPSALYLRDNPEPQVIEVWIDQVLALETTIAGISGRIRLPLLSAGQHHIELRSEATRWYINNTAQTGQTHLLRTAYTMTPDKRRDFSIAFTVSTSGVTQQLGVWLYAPTGTRALDCQLRLQADRREFLQPSHSIRDFSYRIANQEYEQSYALQRRESKLRGPTRLLVPLDADLPAQTVTAHLVCDQPGVLASAGLISQGRSTFQYFEERHETY